MPNMYMEIPNGWDLKQLNSYHLYAENKQHTGEVQLNCFMLLSGLFLMDIKLNCGELPAEYPNSAPPFTINWCLSGRCEVDLGQRGSLVVSQQNLCISNAAASSFLYPTKHYEGIEIFFNPSQIDEQGWQVLSSFGLDSNSIETLFSLDVGAFVCSPEGSILETLERLADELKKDVPPKERLLLCVLDLLVHLKTQERSELLQAGTYLQKGQREMAQRVHSQIDESMPPQLDLAGLSCDLGVSEASLKTYFYKIYGLSPAAYARERALSYAASQLRISKARITDIAAAAGYANASKFSAAFAKQFGMPPIEYRRRYCLEHKARDKEGM